MLPYKQALHTTQTLSDLHLDRVLDFGRWSGVLNNEIMLLYDATEAHNVKKHGIAAMH